MSHYDENKHDSAGTPDPLSKASPTGTSTTEAATAAPVSDRRLSNAAIQTQCQSEHDREIPEVDLMSPLTLRGITFRNRIAMSPMCMYSAHDGFANDFHLVHLGGRAIGGVGLVVVEATAVTAEGRISPGDMGIWKDEHIEPLARIARFVEMQGAIPGVQLAHAGRKASCDAPWTGGSSLKTPAEGGWPVIGPSPLPFHADDLIPTGMSEIDIEYCVEAWETAARRALDAGFKVIELHAAHGYLMHEFLSPLSNHRTDNYGGSLANRMRLLTYDVGPMQFNTAYLADLSRYGITAEHVAQSGCYSYTLAAWRIRMHIHNDRGDLWTKVANYHSYTPHLNTAYQVDLMRRAARWEKWLNTRFSTRDVTFQMDKR